MKTNKLEIQELKKRHRLELVMQETGESFEVNSTNSDRWLSKNTSGLIVDIRKQIYEIKFPGKDESGDVIAWLKRRYSWTFGMAIRFLKKRLADPARQDVARSEKPKKNQSLISAGDATKPLDRWQDEALQIGGERIREFFSWSYWELVMYRVREEVRIEPVHAPDITHCQRCDDRLHWLSVSKNNFVEVSELHGYKLQRSGPIPVIAYSIKRPLKISDFGKRGDDLFNAFDQLSGELNTVFVEDEDGLVCEKCAWKEFDFVNALSLCEKSAYIREQAEEEMQREQSREAWEEQERQTARDEEELISQSEANSDSAAGGERTELL